MKIVKNPNICRGKPTIEGTRWPVRNIISLAVADGPKEFIKEFEGMTPEMISAALRYAADNLEVLEKSKADLEAEAEEADEIADQMQII